MAQLTPITLDDGAVIYIEVAEDVETPSDSLDSYPPEGATRTAKGAGKHVAKSFHAMQGTIRAYTHYTLNAFKHLSGANVDKVTLEFGIKVAGEAGVPYVTKGTAESNLKITVECSFPTEK